MRLDEDRLDALRRWGHALQGAEGEGYAAAGRGILMLIEEIERLRLELLLRTREQRSRVDELSGDEAVEKMEEPVASTLYERLQRAVGGDSGSSPGADSAPGEDVESGTEGERATNSPQSWIESLRRQK